MNETVKDPPRMLHNSRLSVEYITRNRVCSRYPKVSDQIETIPLEKKLKPHGYNPSIIDDNGFLLLAYRYHPEPTPMTKLAVAQVDVTGEIVSNIVLATEPGRSAEDPKLFSIGSEIWISFVSSTWPQMPAKAVVKYGCCNNSVMHQTVIQPALPGNDDTTIQKNWVFFVREDSLYCIYQCHPDQWIYLFPGSLPKQNSIQATAVPVLTQSQPGEPLVTTGPRWAYGAIKGGTAPIEYDGKLLRFFHSTLDNEFSGHHRRYYMGACLMEPTPPFQTVRVSRKPILFGSEIDDLRVKERPKHWKANVVFPGGVVKRGNGWLVAVGINDSDCLIAKIKPEDLHL